MKPPRRVSWRHPKVYALAPTGPDPDKTIQAMIVAPATIQSSLEARCKNATYMGSLSKKTKTHRGLKHKRVFRCRRGGAPARTSSADGSMGLGICSLRVVSDS